MAATATEKCQVITRNLFQGSQSWRLKGVYKLGNGNKLQIDIVRDAHDSQSYATVEAWDAASLKWNRLAALTPDAMAVLAKNDRGYQLVNYTSRALASPEIGAFAKDEQALLELAKAIIL